MWVDVESRQCYSSILSNKRGEKYGCGKNKRKKTCQPTCASWQKRPQGKALPQTLKLEKKMSNNPAKYFSGQKLFDFEYCEPNDILWHSKTLTPQSMMPNGKPMATPGSARYKKRRFAVNAKSWYLTRVSWQISVGMKLPKTATYYKKWNGIRNIYR